MSYSRWGNSRWYTFWCGVQPEGQKENKDNTIFSICGLINFSSKDIRDDIDVCLSVVSKKDPKASRSELEELRTYMEEFLLDVDNDYKMKT